MLAGFRAFCETSLFAAPLEQVAAFTNRDALYAWAEGSPGDAAHFLRLSRALGLAGLGRTSLRHMSFGAYASSDGPLFARGVFHAQAGAAAPLPLGAIAEDVSHAWYRGEGGPAQCRADARHGKPGCL
jgi:hydrogenase large subunit